MCSFHIITILLLLLFLLMFPLTILFTVTYIPDWKNVVGRSLQTINATTQCFAGKHLNYLLICILKAVHLHCLSILISHFVRPSLMYPTVNEWLMAGLSSTEQFSSKNCFNSGTDANFGKGLHCVALKLALVGQFGHFQVGLHSFHCHLQLAAINISHKRTGLNFEYANDNVHLPKNPLGLIVCCSCFSPDNVFFN